MMMMVDDHDIKGGTATNDGDDNDNEWLMMNY